MNRREFITTGSAAAATLTGGITVAHAGCPGEFASEPASLAVAMPWRDQVKGPGDIALRVLRRIEELSDGRIRFDVTHAPPGAAAGRMPGGARAFDVVFGTEHDMVREHPAFAYFAGLPGHTALDATALSQWLQVAGGYALWEHLARPFGYQPILCGHLGAGPRIFSRAPIRDAANFKGLAIYAPGLSARVAEGLGALPMTMLDFAEAPGAFADGRVDAIETGSLYQAMQMDLHRHGRFASQLGLVPSGTTMTMRVATRTWDGLAPSDKALVDLAAREVYVATLTETRLHQDVIARALAEQHGTEFAGWTRELEAALTRISDAVVAHAAGHDATSREIDQSYRAFRARCMAPIQSGPALV